MPSAKNSDYEVPQVDAFTALLKNTLDHAQSIKPSASIEPPLTQVDFESQLAQVPTIFESEKEKAHQNAVIEIATRNIFSSLVATTTIDSPEFVQVWNLFDFLSVLSDNDQCDPALLFWLVEELLDSQTTEKCRKIFDYLESRREQIIIHNLIAKKLVILRFCNDLLRRLSRAEDTAFCGRVFIFMFQCFPLGDRSSVNLRGEYHVENVTTFEDIPTQLNDSADIMVVDTEPDSGKDGKGETKSTTKAVSFDSKNKPAPEKPLDTDALYPVFWSLQHYFSQPTALFDSAELGKFKAGLEATMSAFETVEKLQRTTKGSDENKLIPQKRKQSEGDDDLRSSTNNPKYLTSRELFELEISDLYFRRHILIQAFIILDFLLSLTPKARAKLSNIKVQNRSVVYADQTLGTDDMNWATFMKIRIQNYIQAENDGFFFFRVLESVISRDKGWVRWKVESCPPIKRDPVSPEDFNEAKASAKRMTTNKRLRAVPMGSLSLEFLKEEDSETAMEKLKDPERWKLPDLAVFKDKIASDDLDLDFAKSEKEKSEILDAKASKTWRALRIARRSKLAVFDKIDDWQKVDVIFQEQPKAADGVEGAQTNGQLPEDRRPIIITGPSKVGKSTLVSMLLEKHEGVFEKVIQHTTRSPNDGEVDGQDYHFVDSKAFNAILDGDYFLEFSNRDGVDYGTNRKAADALEESGKVPVIQLDREGVQMAKDNGYAARIVFISPPSIEELEARLRKSDGFTEETIQSALKAAQEDMEKAQSEGFCDAVITNGELEVAYKALEEFLYGGAPAETNGVNGNADADAAPAGAGEDVAMQDAASGEVAA
ncbi:THO complex subunit 1 transcription elongation factor-domain-containing protein [Annulohypoxylon truncatum]|uniref:THO complex subunit 1 transcription elongation factor-domain-containing protein n=1 Tax=Annulohypoxylon truncatum TaxID=327061 RepID=UPI002008B71A|nr:THO complex subunit 1 transcription elongation factor-domain-containing protein [Annulohypoxylon truncatum]KAI1213115.1 THO complex subunit 1 transcription elongation factor-domain-containing protein [Annulohypoxylon truncatum]